MTFRSRQGSTLGLVAAMTATLVIIGCALFLLIRMLGGDKQIANLTDSATITAARSILAVSVPANDPSIPPEFQGLGVNVPPDPAQPNLAAGAPDPVHGKFNIFAYNRAAGACALIAMNAVEDGT